MVIGKTNISEEITTDIISRHDLVFRSPVPDPLSGIPLGNGHTGWLVWTDDSRLIININDTDLIDDGEIRSDGYVTAYNESNTVCVNGAVLTVDFGCPAFEAIYQNDYEARLNLGEAKAELNAATPFISTAAEAFVSSEYETGVLSIDSSSTEGYPLRISLERWGSRTFMYWYSSLGGSASDGLDGTSSGLKNNTIFLVQQLRGTTFCIAASIDSEIPAEYRKVGTHTTEAYISASSKHSITLYISLAVAETPEKATETAFRKLSSARAAGKDAILSSHLKEWRNFWNRSYISLPSENEFIENLWYLNLYYANCEMRGQYPPHFCSGIWGSYHDFVPWNLYFHYNTQHAIYPLDPTGHPELGDTYYHFRASQLGQAKKYAKEIKGTLGIFFADVCDMKGRMSDGVSDNCTCGTQIALIFYYHWLYCRDQKFLSEKVIPLINGCLEFYMSLFTKEDDGFYHIHGTQGYEGSPLLDDSITDHAAFRALLKAGIDIFPDRNAELSEYLDNLAPYETADFLDDELDENERLRYGIGRGEKPVSKQLLSVGRNDGKILRKTFGSPEHDYYGFPDTEMAPLYPSGLVGLNDRDSELFRLIKNSVLLHHHVVHGGDNAERGVTCMGWCMMPVYLARMGMSDKLWDFLSDTVSSWIIYPQGFGAYTPSDIDQDLRRMNETTGADGTKYRSLAQRFRHFDYETLPICAYAVTEALMQSYDGTIRLFPTVNRDKDYAFTLYAVGGFKISAVYDRMKFFAEVTSTIGGLLKISADNVSSGVIIEGPSEISCERGVYTTATSPEDKITLYTESGIPEIDKDISPNSNAKHLGKAILGGDKEF